jgi:hypothetical protein
MPPIIIKSFSFCYFTENKQIKLFEQQYTDEDLEYSKIFFSLSEPFIIVSDITSNDNLIIEKTPIELSIWSPLNSNLNLDCFRKQNIDYYLNQDPNLILVDNSPLGHGIKG